MPTIQRPQPSRTRLLPAPVSITGTAEAPGRVGVSATDIGTGMYAHAAVLEALLARQKTGEGRAISVSLFSSMAEWMTVPLLARDYAAYEWPRLGLTHPFIAPYGVYQTADKVPVLISIQNDREFERLCHGVLDRPGLEKDPDYATNKARNAALLVSALNPASVTPALP